MGWYVVDSKRLTWNREGKFWFESVEETRAFGDSWDDVKNRLGINHGVNT